MSEQLVQLPFEVQAVLAIGYLSYRLATTGVDRSHRTGDFVLQILVYGAIAKGIQELAIQHGESSYWRALFIGGVITLALAACWRGFLHRLLVEMVRKIGITRENYSPTTWSALIQNPTPWRYVQVCLEDGTRLESDIDQVPESVPHAPLDVDPDGNIALYVTSKTCATGDEEDFGKAGIVDDHGRAHITYIPRERINRITISLATKQSAT